MKRTRIVSDKEVAQRKAIAAALAGGMVVEEAERKFGVSYNFVRKVCRDFRITPLSKANKRRQALTAAVAKGMTVNDAARKFGFSAAYTRLTCLAAEVIAKRPRGRPRNPVRPLTESERAIAKRPRGRPRAKIRNLFEVLKLRLKGERQTKIAERYGVSKQRISLIVAQARSAGFDV